MDQLNLELLFDTGEEWCLELNLEENGLNNYKDIERFKNDLMSGVYLEVYTKNLGYVCAKNDHVKAFRIFEEDVRKNKNNIFFKLLKMSISKKGLRKNKLNAMLSIIIITGFGLYSLWDIYLILAKKTTHWTYLSLITNLAFIAIWVISIKRKKK